MLRPLEKGLGIRRIRSHEKRGAGTPDQIDVHIVERPGQPFLGSGEAAQGPAAGALANAIANAAGTRLRDLPLTRSRIKTAM